MLERRRYVRIPENSQISYRILPDIKTKAFLTRDISQGGIRFFVHEFIPANSNLQIRLALEKISFSFEAFVKVIWTRKDAHSERYEIGVEFMNIPKKAADHLIDYIKSALSYS